MYFHLYYSNILLKLQFYIIVYQYNKIILSKLHNVCVLY